MLIIKITVKAINTNPLLNNHHNPQDISIAYTAMHGVGADMAETLLADAGFKYVYSVAAQREPDGAFPTVKFPNPEEQGAMDLVIAGGETTRGNFSVR